MRGGVPRTVIEIAGYGTLVLASLLQNRCRRPVPLARAQRTRRALRSESAPIAPRRDHIKASRRPKSMVPVLSRLGAGARTQLHHLHFSSVVGDRDHRFMLFREPCRRSEHGGCDGAGTESGDAAARGCAEIGAYKGKGGREDGYACAGGKAFADGETNARSTLEGCEGR